MFDEDKLRAFGRLVIRLQRREDLSREEVREAYRQIWRNEQPDLQQGAFIAALRAKGETGPELSGVVEAFQDEWQLFFPHVVESREPALAIVGIGMDGLKTVNVSSGAAVLAAACGLFVHKAGAPALPGVSGSADTFACWGVDVEAPGVAQVQATARCGLGFTCIVSSAFAQSGFARVISQIRIGTSFHIGGPLVRHVGERHKIVGVPEPILVRLVCEVMRDLGYERALVPCGESRLHPGRYLDEFSTAGQTHVAELLPSGEILEYIVQPRDAGLPETPFEAIATLGTAMENARVVARALAGKESGPLVEVLLFNAAAGLKLMGHAPDLPSGVAIAREAIREGRAIGKLRELIETQNRSPAEGLAKLEALLAD